MFRLVLFGSEIVGLRYTLKTSVTGVEMLRQVLDQGKAGDNVTITIELGKAVAMEKGQRFALREGGKTIGAGQILEIVK